MIRTNKYKMYQMQVRTQGGLLIVPVGANSEEEAVGMLLGMGYKRSYIVGAANGF